MFPEFVEAKQNGKKPFQLVRCGLIANLQKLLIKLDGASDYAHSATVTTTVRDYILTKLNLHQLQIF